MPVVKVVMNGAISIVNAVATGKGATLGTSLKTTILVHSSRGEGVSMNDQNINNPQFLKLITKQIVPFNILQNTHLHISVDSNMPIGCGLKSSSVLSTGILMACNKLFKLELSESQLLNASAVASLKAGVSLTGAYDDACGCYYGGFIVTDNVKNKIIKSEKCIQQLSVVIFIPKYQKRCQINSLKKLDFVFHRAWLLAKNSNYWNAMTLNGMATALIFDSSPDLIISLLEKGAIAASTSGNGTAIAAITKQPNLNTIKNVFTSYAEGETLLTTINNNKPQIHEL